MKPFFKYGFLIMVGYVVFSSGQWIAVRIQSEKQVKAVCQNIKKNMSKNDLINLISANQDFKMYHSNKNEMFFYTLKSLPETPTCHIKFKHDRVEKIIFFDDRNREV